MESHPKIDSKSYSNYLQQRSFIGDLYHKWILFPRINSALNGKVLDYGCGIGNFLAYRDNTIGVDINPNNIEYCRSLGRNAIITQKDIIPFEDKSFDGVIMDNVLEHIPICDTNPILKEVNRVLRPFGNLLIGVPGEKGYASDADHKHYYDKAELLELLSRHNFAPKRIQHLPFYFPGIGKYLSQYCIYITFERHRQLQSAR